MTKMDGHNKLNYIKLINHFWAVNLEYNFTGNEAKFYFYLLYVSNSLSWKNPFKQSLRQINRGTGISINSIKACQKRLIDAGVISVKNGRAGNHFNYENKTEYYITSVSNNDTHADTHLDTHADTHPDTDTDTHPDTINKLKETKQKERKSKSFSPPSLQEIQSCFDEKINGKELKLNSEMEAEKFESYYGSNGWMVGKNKMRNWRKAVSGWIARSQNPYYLKENTGTWNQNILK
jgi:hypothetical protein